VIDSESERAVTSWLRLGDRVAGRKPVDGRCDRCGRNGYLTAIGNERVCAGCGLDAQL